MSDAADDLAVAYARAANVEQDAKIAFARAAQQADLDEDRIHDARFYAQEAADHLLAMHGYDPHLYAQPQARKAVRSYAYHQLLTMEPTASQEFRLLEKTWFRAASRAQRAEERVANRAEFGPQPGDAEYVSAYDILVGRPNLPRTADSSQAVHATSGTRVVELTQAEYDAIVAGVGVDANTVYIIVD